MSDNKQRSNDPLKNKSIPSSWGKKSSLPDDWGQKNTGSHVTAGISDHPSSYDTSSPDQSAMDQPKQSDRLSTYKETHSIDKRPDEKVVSTVSDARNAITLPNDMTSEEPRYHDRRQKRKNSPIDDPIEDKKSTFSDGSHVSQYNASQVEKNFPEPGSNKSGVIIVLLAIIAILLLAGGILTGILITKKNEADDHTMVESSNSDTVVETEAATSTTVEKTTEIEEVTTVLTTTAADTTSAPETKVENFETQKNKILASVDNAEYAGKDSHLENAPSDMRFYDIDGDLSKVTISSPVLYSGPGTSYSEVYRTSANETFNVVGENNDWLYLMFYSGAGQFSHMTYGYANKNGSPQNTIKPTASISIEPQVTIYEGAHLKIVINGDHDYYTYDFYWDGGGSYNCPWESGTSSAPSMLLDGPDVIVHATFNVTPYYNGGIAGDTVSLSYDGPWKIWAQNYNSVTSVNKLGRISAPNGGPINGYTTSYIVDNGAVAFVRTDLMDNWHIRAVSEYYDGSTYWYELYDADDGDYYGWISEKNISFY